MSRLIHTMQLLYNNIWNLLEVTRDPAEQHLCKYKYLYFGGYIVRSTKHRVKR